LRANGSFLQAQRRIRAAADKVGGWLGDRRAKDPRRAEPMPKGSDVTCIAGRSQDQAKLACPSGSHHGLQVSDGMIVSKPASSAGRASAIRSEGANRSCEA
jgi:hypothetical protein